jgi:hypothetical protein
MESNITKRIIKITKITNTQDTQWSEDHLFITHESQKTTEEVYKVLMQYKDGVIDKTQPELVSRVVTNIELPIFIPPEGSAFNAIAKLNPLNGEIEMIDFIHRVPLIVDTFPVFY